MASSLRPKPSGVCRYSTRPTYRAVSRLPLPAAFCSASATAATCSGPGGSARNTACTAFGFGSSGYGLSRITRASSSRVSTSTRGRMPSCLSSAASMSAARPAGSARSALNSAFPLWMYVLTPA